MIDKSDEYDALVEQKMQARAERHIRENQAEHDQHVRETEVARAVQARDEQLHQQHLSEMRVREVAAEARRNRPALIVQYRANPAGVRLVTTLRDVCLKCGSEQVRCLSDALPRKLVCPDCATKWTASACWSCTTGLLDSRDPETPRCPQCGWSKCAVCDACNPQGCSTNTYSLGHRQRDEVAV
jgi:hypothetical protein